MDFRIGHGYDVHRLVSGRRLIIGGVEIPFEKGLDGHSDADVAAHAITDAILGAAGLGDIGGMFPDTDESFLNADSIMLLEKAVSRVLDVGYKISNIDVTIVAQRPKLKEFIPLMRQKIAKACKIDVERVNVKATTEENLGFTGEEKGISAHSVCLVFGE